MAFAFPRLMQPNGLVIGKWVLVLSLSLCASAFAADTASSKKKKTSASTKVAQTAKTKATKRSKTASASALTPTTPPAAPPTSIYRCSSSTGAMQYSQMPCDTPARNLTNAAWRDERLSQQLKDSQAIAKRDEKLLKTMRRDLARDEKEAMAAHAVPKASTRQMPAKNKAEKAASPKDRTDKPKRFRAVAQAATPAQGLQAP